MLVSLNWLRELVAVQAADDEVARRLTMAGFEVESVQRIGEGVMGARVAEVKARAPHPQADKLTVVEVADGHGVRRVVCGAPNVPAPGGKVALAPPGTILPGGLEVRARAVRGVESEGMLCSEAELQVGEDAAGILLLPDEVPTGAALADAMRLRDTILDLAVAPNRPDGLGHLGIARELSALFVAPLALPDADLGALHGPPAEQSLSVEVRDAERCPRYIARLIDGVRVEASPFWLRYRLRSLSVRPLANVVDVTNLVMLETGQPLHAFDVDRVAGGRIVVRRADAGEILLTLDGQSRELCSDDLLIADARAALALAGIMGGSDSSVGETTRRIALEAAAFDARGIRRTSRRLGLRSESSIRFERGCDLDGVEYASRRAARLIAELGHGRVAPGSIDRQAARRAPRKIRFRADRCRALLGMDLPAGEMVATLERLGMTVRAAEGEAHEVEVPSFRMDVTRPADLCEEVVRIQGLDGLPATLPSGTAAPEPSGDALCETVRDTLCALGLHETISLAFSGPTTMRAPGEPPAVQIKNPLREDMTAMRTWLLPGLLCALARNRDRGVTDVALFEIGRVFFARPDRELPDEPMHVAALLSGKRPEWLAAGPDRDFFDIKGLLEEIAGTLRFELLFGRSAHSFLHPGIQAEVGIAKGSVIGWTGQLHPALCHDLGVKTALAFEIDLGAVPALALPRMVALPRHPAVVRDLSFFVAAPTAWDEIRAALVSGEEPLVEDVRIHEDYREPGRVPPGQKGIFLSVRYRARDRTLTDEEVNAAHERLVSRLSSRIPVLRR